MGSCPDTDIDLHIDIIKRTQASNSLIHKLKEMEIVFTIENKSTYCKNFTLKKKFCSISKTPAL